MNHNLCAMIPWGRRHLVDRGSGGRGPVKKRCFAFAA